MTECSRKADSYQPAAEVEWQHWSQAYSVVQSRTREVFELAPGVELAPGPGSQAACPGTKEHRRSPQVSDPNIPSRKVCQDRALTGPRGPCWDSRRNRTIPVLLPVLTLVQAMAAEWDHCLVAQVH